MTTNRKNTEGEEAGLTLDASGHSVQCAEQTPRHDSTCTSGAFPCSERDAYQPVRHEGKVSRDDAGEPEESAREARVRAAIRVSPAPSPSQETLDAKLSRIKRELDAVPTEPGVYLWKDAAGNVIYVGKAKQLRARMRQYVNYQDSRAKIPLLVSDISSFEYIVVASEHESLVLEKNLIQQYKPFYNADFKDDKSYPFIAITKGDVYPAIKYTREKHNRTTKYFGPYTDSRAARELVDIARRVVPICAASCADWRTLNRKCTKIRADFKKAGEGEGAGLDAKTSEHLAQSAEQTPRQNSTCIGCASPRDWQEGRRLSRTLDETKAAPTPAHLEDRDALEGRMSTEEPARVARAGTDTRVGSVTSPSPNYSSAYGEKLCFDAHVGLGPGACAGRISPALYAQNVGRLERFLSGRVDEFVEELTAQMREAASELDFERAARYKDRIDTINSLEVKQHAVSSRNLDADVIGIAREETIAAANVLVIREGRIIAANEFILNRGNDVPAADLLHNFMLRYYDTTTLFPHEIIVADMPEDADVMEAWLTGRLASTHGAKVRITLPERGEKAELLEMAALNARHALMRYKVRTSYDDTRINQALGQLESALALDAPPMRIECFDISTLHGAYTVASMVVFTGGKPDKNQYRRFKIKTPLTEANDFLSMQEVMARRYSKERLADARFGARPDLIVLDGGRPQLNAALEMFEQMGVNIPVVGLAKRDEEVFVPWDETGPVVLPGGSASLYLIKQIRDEAHRFAITFHRELRGKGMTRSILDTVPGIGPVRKRALLKHFKSMKNLREASMEDLQAAKILPKEVAADLHAVLQQFNNQTPAATNAKADEAGEGEGGEDTTPT